MKKRLMVAAGICSTGGLIFGYDLGALSAATAALRDQFALRPSAFGLTVSASLWGMIGGSLIAGRVVDRIGRRNLIAACATIYALVALCFLLPLPLLWSVVVLLRFLAGLTIGGFSVACPLYLSEIAPVAWRGRFVTLFQLQIGAGVVVAFAFGAAAAHLTSIGSYWKWCLGSGSVPAVLLLLLLLRFVPDDQSLPSMGQRWRASRTESRARPATKQGAPLPAAPGAAGKLFSRRYLHPLVLATCVAVFNQLSGVNILLLYLLEVLSSAGLGRFLGHTYSVWIACCGLVCTLLGMAAIDKLGRKALLMIGACGMAICLSGLGYAISHSLAAMWYLVLLGVYNLFFATSQGAVVWVYLSELFPLAVRGKGQGYGSTVLSAANAGLIWLFPVLHHYSLVRTFYALALIMVVQVVVVRLWYPETKGGPLGVVA